MVSEMKLSNRLFKKLRQYSYEKHKPEAVFDILEGLKKHHHPTYMHCIRVGLKAGEIAIKQSQDPTLSLWGGALHDIGKLYVPADILSKRKLQAIDWEKIRVHPVEGHDLLFYKYHLNGPSFIALTHHHGQERPYPTGEEFERRANMHLDVEYLILSQYTTYVALADKRDALGRNNNFFDKPIETRKQKEKALSEMVSPSCQTIVRELCSRGVL